ncbi:MAG: pitrilysin family protein [Rikenellaceae bacterium]
MEQNNITDISLASAECRELKNGVKIYTLNSDEFEVLRVTFVFGAGSVMQHKPFAATSTANMLCEGTAEMNAHQIAERLDYYGSYFDVNIDRDYTYISFCSLTKFVEPTLDVAAQIILHPIFDERELEIYAAKRKQRLKIEREKVETRAREEFAKSLFGAAHPYAESFSEDEYDNLTRDDLVKTYERLYIAENCFVVCSGRVGEYEMESIERIAEALPQGVKPAARDLTKVEQRRYFLTPKQGAVQSSIRIGRLLFGRSHPDFVGMQILSSLLGGYFGSRLMRTLREERGYTYGVMSAMVNFAHAGYFAVATQVAVEVVDDALKLIYEEIERLRTEPISPEELEMVKRIMKGEIMRVLDGPFGVADVTIENILCGRDNDAIEENVRAIEAATPEDLMTLAQKYLDFDDLVTVVSGAR